ncbi:MAG: leucine-rich repeat domain-containing protein, partial [Thermoguttaceae bacterium]|nr:leucine-rich repeat domain-containing protein [Thermoguttaceae bacterium]
YRLFAGLEPKSYKIPDGVLVIKRAALGGNATLEELTIPESVTTIEHNAFYRCSSLKKIRIPAKVVDLNLYAFTHCDSLESFEVAPENPKFKSENGALLSKDGKTFYKIVAVERDPSAAPYVLPPTEADDQQRETAAYKNPIYRVPDGVETIAADAFSDMWRTRNAFTEIVLPESLKTIQRTAFQHCSRLETLRVPASVETIGSAAFARCYALKTFEIDPENPAYYVADGTLVSKKGKTVCDIILDQKRTVWKIPEGVERLDATWVTVRFDIPEIVLPESLTQIGADSLAKSQNLTKITIPKNVREVEKGAFAMCPKLEEVVLKSANTKIKDDAFVSSVPNPFEPPTPANVKIRVEPDEEDAAESAESTQTAESAQTGDAANVDGGTTYDEAAKKFDVRIVDGEATILGTRLQEPTLKIPERIDGSPVTKIAPKAFANNEFVKEIVLPSTLREIGADAFFECVALEKISPLPAGLSFDCVRDLRFFTGCDALQGVSVDPNNQYFKDVDGVLFDKTGTTIYFYPRVRTDEFYQVPDGVQRIGDLAFAGNLHIKRVKFPWTLRMIDTSAFGGCRSLEAAEFFPVVNSLRTIAYGAFSGCDALKSINLPDGLLRVRTNAFHCRSLEKVEFYPVTIDAEEARETLLSENANVAGTLGEKSGMNIETGAFKTPNLKSFELPETLVELQAGAIQPGLENLRTGVAVDAAERNRDKLVFKLPRNMKGFSPGAFNGAVNLQAFEVDPTDERWSTVDGVLLSKDGKTLYCYPGAKDGLEYDVPEGVETIEAAAFSGSG